MGHDNEARLGALTVAVGARTSDRGPTIGDLPNGVEIARQMAIVVELEHSRDPADRQRAHCAALRAGCLMPRPGHPEHPDPALLGAVTWLEELGAPVDTAFWSLIPGGRPESHHKHDVGSHRPSGSSRAPADPCGSPEAAELLWSYETRGRMR